MSQLIETIRLHDGEFANLIYHQQRMDDSFRSVYGANNGLRLSDILKSSVFPSQGLFKCRFIYDDKNHHVEFEPYTIRPVASLKIVNSNEIAYPFKYKDRSQLMELFRLRAQCDDVLMVKNGNVTDTSYANIVFKKGDRWITPSSFLLKGTMRQFLIDSGRVEEEPVLLKDIYTFEKFKLINSMLQWDSPETDISNIV